VHGAVSSADSGTSTCFVTVIVLVLTICTGVAAQDASNIRVLSVEISFEEGCI